MEAMNIPKIRITCAKTTRVISVFSLIDLAAFWEGESGPSEGGVAINRKWGLDVGA